MGLFDFGKKQKKPAKKEKIQEKKSAAKPKHHKEEPFEMGDLGLIFEAKVQILTKEKKYADEVAKSYVESIKASEDAKKNKKYYLIKHGISTPEKLKKDETKEMNEAGDVFVVNLDFEIGVKKKTNIFDFCFEYMPYMIEIIEPMNISFSSHDLTIYLTNIQATLHKVDESLKQNKLVNEQLLEKHRILTANMIRMLRNNILLSLKEKNKDAKEIAKNVGIPEEQIKPFLDNMVKDKELKLVKNKYAAVK